MSVFHGANNTTINNANFNAISTTVTNNAIPLDDIIAVLLCHSATAGLLDAAERFDAPKCSEGTRVSMLLGMKKFVRKGGPASVFWLHGPAGVGKSALAQSLGLSLKKEGDHAASFFFSRTAPGRNDGNQLIATLACQLALNIPPLKPLIAKAVKANPLVFNATNLIKMRTLIVDPLNQLHKSFRSNPLSWLQRVVKRKSHPRLILVDGLDECNDTLVQRDILLCIAHAVQHLSLPFRFVIVSRPELHIITIFKLDPIFQGPDGIKVATKNLGDDEGADEQIAIFLVKEFAEIRRTHPIREFLPQPWPLPGQITQLVSKSSQSFIYPATVIRYIKTVHNRPDECLERILGMSEIPTRDKPYEPLDRLYRFVFDSVPEVNKEAVRNIFLFLAVPNNARNFVITPRVIEKYYDYKPGHVQHVLQDLLCIVATTTNDEPIKVLHASLPDFLTDPSRSVTLYIEAAAAHAAIALSMFDAPDERTLMKSFFSGDIVYPLMHSDLTEKLLDAMIKTNLVGGYKLLSKNLSLLKKDEKFYSLHFESTNVPARYINNHIKGLETYILQSYSPAVLLYAVVDDLIHEIFPSLRKCLMPVNPCVEELYETIYTTQRPSQLVLRISKLHMLMMVPCYLMPAEYLTATDSVVKLADPLVAYPQLAHAFLRCLEMEPKWTPFPESLYRFAVDIISISLARSGYYYYEPLHNYLKEFVATPPLRFNPDTLKNRKHDRRLTTSVEQYLERVRLQAPQATR